MRRFSALLWLSGNPVMRAASDKKKDPDEIETAMSVKARTSTVA
jgi:hypothetical protein